MASKGKFAKTGKVAGVAVTSAKASRRRTGGDKESTKESLAFKILTAPQTQEVLDLQDVYQVQDKVEEIMKIENHTADLQQASLLDYYTGALWWGKEQMFTAEQLSAFFTVVHTVLDNLREKQMNIVENLKEYKKMLVGIGQETIDASGGLECFDVEQAKQISDYLFQSIFEHYKLYEFMFSHKQAEEIIGTDLDVELVPLSDIPWPPPLDEGVPEEIYTSFIATPPPTPAPEASESKSTTDGAGDGEAPEEAAVTEGGVEKEDDLLARLNPEEIKDIIKEVFDEMLGGLQGEVAQKIKERENALLARINKIHRVAEK